MQRQPLVLNVDDDPDNRSLKTLLLQEGGFDVIEVATGRDALARVATDQPRIVLLDICLGDMDGYEVCRQIRSRADTEWIGIVHITANLLSPGDWRASVAAGANSYLTYPMDASMLLSTLRALVARQDVERAAQLERDRLRAHREAREQLYHTILDQTVAGVYVIQGRQFTFVNHALAEMLGATIEELLALPSVLDVVHDDDRPHVAEAFRQREAGEALAIRHTIRVRRKDRGWAMLETHGAHGQYEGEPAIMGLAIDRTRRHELEEQLKQSQKMDAIGQLAGGIAHDFNNQLMAILGYCGMALEQIDAGKPLYADLREIEKAASSATALTRKLLSFGRRQMMHLETIDLNVAVENVASLLRRLLDDHITLELRLGAGLGAVMADRIQLEQVVLNLVLNARDAMPEGGRVTVSTSRIEVGPPPPELVTLPPGRYLELVVSDDGAGMTPDTLAHLFEPFFTTKDPGTGTGLGLATAYGTIKQFNGHVRVTSTWGQGSTFRVYLPCTDHVSADPDEVTRTAAAVGTETILLVEDEPTVLDLTARVLRRHGYHVFCAATPDAAWAYVQQPTSTPITMMVSDVVMPGMTGAELTRRLRQAGIVIPVLLMSGYAEDVRNTLASLPGTRFLRKPVAPQLLLETVRDMLDGVSEHPIRQG